ncbi:MAG TPA: ABC transporter ATP-binding protein [Candidatus Limnocylindrales bacterium]|nr:ABC transporter ATP-binding protein [Candidatus Limnocylindrales bacterium]
MDEKPGKGLKLRVRVVVPMEPGKPAKRSTLGLILHIARPYWPHLTLIFLLNLIAAPITLLLAFPLKIAVDNVIGQQQLPQVLARLIPHTAHPGKPAILLLAVGLLIVLSLLLNLQSFATWLLQTYTGEKLVLDLRTQLFWHVQRMGLLFHDKRGTSEVAYRIQNDAPAVQYIFLQGVMPLVSSTLSFLALLYVTIRIDWVLSVIALSISPVLFVLARKSSRRARAGWDDIKKLDSSAMLVLYEALSSIRVVKAFGQEQFEDQRFKLRSRHRMQEQVKVASMQAMFHVLITTTIALGSALAMWVGVHHVQTGVLTLGELLLVMAYMTQLYDPLRTISAKMPELQSWIVSINRAVALMDEAPEVAEPEFAIPASRVEGDIRFSNVMFDYPSSGRALNGVSFQVPAGTRVGIIGPSGSGKSTLVNLLTRFYDPSSGEILLDGNDLRQYRLADLRQQFSIILQEPVVFSATVAENIAYARHDATREEIIQAAKAARAHDFITALPDGYDTRIGDGGCRLSGGQRQRLAIARAFLKDAPVLIFDEPTSAVDIHTEQEIMQATEQLVRGRTTFIIAHRLSTVKQCDMLLVLKEGKLAAVTENFREAISALAETTKTETWPTDTVADVVAT